MLPEAPVESFHSFFRDKKENDQETRVKVKIMGLVLDRKITVELLL